LILRRRLPALLRAPCLADDYICRAERRVCVPDVNVRDELAQVGEQPRALVGVDASDERAFLRVGERA
jgi:hypothetical protein